MTHPVNPLHYVEGALRLANHPMSLAEIALTANVTEDDARIAVRQLSQAGQIEYIPGGRSGARYAWLATKPVLPAAAVAPMPEPVAEAPTTGAPVESEEIKADIADLLSPADAEALEEALYLVRVPKRKPRIMSNGARAQKAALAAVRNGAPRADVFTLIPAGTASRGAVWAE